MREDVKTGVSFGLTSGVITTLGLMVGLHSGTGSTLAVIGGIVTIAIADAMSDAMGIHVAKEAENVFSSKQLWMATVITFVAKLAVAMTFLIPVLVYELDTAILISVVWGLGLLVVLSYKIARAQGERPIKAIAEHVVFAVVVVTITHFVGDWVAATFA